MGDSGNVLLAFTSERRMQEPQICEARDLVLSLNTSFFLAFQLLISQKVLLGLLNVFAALPTVFFIFFY